MPNEMVVRHTILRDHVIGAITSGFCESKADVQLSYNIVIRLQKKTGLDESGTARLVITRQNCCYDDLNIGDISMEISRAMDERNIGP